tara:strand:+ start:22 stop:354 length:333 start_codon:yes stop_codon:yes gene_type:complete
MSLAERIRLLRAEKKASLQVVADAIEVSKPHIWELEKGKTKNPSLDLLTKLAGYFGVTLDYLAGMDEPKSDQRYSMLFRKLDLEDMSESDLKVVEQAIDFAISVIKEKSE